MFIRRPRGISKGQIVFVTIIGVIGGSYIYQPLFLKLKREKQIADSNVAIPELDSNKIENPVKKRVATAN